MRNLSKFAKHFSEYTVSVTSSLGQVNQNLTLLKNIMLNQEILIEQNKKIIELLSKTDSIPEEPVS